VASEPGDRQRERAAGRGEAALASGGFGIPRNRPCGNFSSQLGSGVSAASGAANGAALALLAMLAAAAPCALLAQDSTPGRDPSQPTDQQYTQKFWLIRRNHIFRRRWWIICRRRQRCPRPRPCWAMWPERRGFAVLRRCRALHAHARGGQPAREGGLDRAQRGRARDDRGWRSAQSRIWRISMRTARGLRSWAIRGRSAWTTPRRINS